MKGWGRGLVLTGLMSATLSAPLFAADAVGDLGQALSGGKVNAELRARWENVGQGNALDDANAYTLRGRLGYTTAQWNQLDLLSEFSGTFLLGPDTYNSGSNGNANLLANIGSSGILDGGKTSVTAANTALVTQTGNIAQQASARSDAAQAILQQTQSAQDSVSGVNLDEEASDLLRYQQAYQAAAQLVSTARDMFNTLLSATRGG